MASRPPLEALHLYARGYADLLAGRRWSAVAALERAAAIDPHSPDTQRLLAEALLQLASPGESAFGLLAAPAGNRSALQRAEEALRRAAELDPDDLDTWYRLGRVKLTRGDPSGAVDALRTATATSDYREHPARALLVDLYLARALDRSGRLDAALARYRKVLDGVSALASGRQHLPRDASELRVLMAREDLLYAEIGAAFERGERWAEAAELYGLAATRPQASPDAQARWARALRRAGRSDDALSVAARLVAATGGHPSAFELLLELAPRPQDAIDRLEQIADASPSDPQLQRGVIEAVVRLGEKELAYRRVRQALAPSVLDGAADRPLLDLALRLARELGRPAEGASLLVEVLAKCRRSDPTVTASAVYELTAPHLPGRLTLAALQQLIVSDEDAPARDFLLATAARPLRRAELSRTALRRAAGRFRPAALAWAADLAFRPNVSHSAREAELAELLAAARSVGGEALAAWIEAWVRFVPPDDGQPAMQPPSTTRLVELAASAGAHDPWSAMALYHALRRDGDSGAIQLHVMRMAQAFPLNTEVQAAAISHLIGTGQLAQAEQRLASLRSLAPREPTLTLMSMAVALRVRRDLALAVRLAEDALEPGIDPAVLALAQQTFDEANRSHDFRRLLAAVVARYPAAVTLLNEHLSRLQAEGEIEALDAALARAEAAAQADPDVLYEIAGAAFYVDRTDIADRLLERVLTLDPGHAAAANDLAYHLAEREPPTAETLDRALQLARFAVAGEPNVAAYLDTLGWIYYRLGDYPQALLWLHKAADQMRVVRPEITDHLGDTLFRLRRTDEAAAWWRRGAEQLRDESNLEPVARRRLRARLEAKLQSMPCPRVATSLSHPDTD